MVTGRSPVRRPGLLAHAPDPAAALALAKLTTLRAAVRRRAVGRQRRAPARLRRTGLGDRRRVGADRGRSPARVVVPAWALALATRTLPRFLGRAGALMVGGNLVDGPRSCIWTRPAARRPLGQPAQAWRPSSTGRIWTRTAGGGRWRVTVAGLAILVGHYWHRRASPCPSSAALALLLAPWLLPLHDAVTPPSPSSRISSPGALGVDRRRAAAAAGCGGSAAAHGRRFPYRSTCRSACRRSARRLGDRARARARVGRRRGRAGRRRVAVLLRPGPDRRRGAGRTRRQVIATARPRRDSRSPARSIGGARERVSLDADAEVRFERHRLAGVHSPSSRDGAAARGIV